MNEHERKQLDYIEHAVIGINRGVNQLQKYFIVATAVALLLFMFACAEPPGQSGTFQDWKDGCSAVLKVEAEPCKGPEAPEGCLTKVLAKYNKCIARYTGS